MIKKPTVIILGAGASKPYGFPSGREILNEIRKNLPPYNPQRWMHILRELHIEQALVGEFVENLIRSGRPSVDAFLEHRNEYLEVGKLVIALSLIPHENEDKLFSSHRGEHSYEYLLNKLIALPGIFGTNRLTIITFNYDRSIEHYLFTALKSSYRISDGKCAEMMKRIPIIHVHGQLGKLPWQGEKSRPYNTDTDHDKVRLAGDQIKVISEKEYTSPDFEIAFDKMIEAEKIYFLGFGYNEMNLHRLKIDEISKISNKTIQGTSYGLGRSEMKDIEEKWGIHFPIQNVKILGFLKDIASLK